MNESWDAYELLLQILDAIYFAAKHHTAGFEAMRREIWKTTDGIQNEIDVVCDTNEKILFTYNPYETTVCDIIGSATTGTPANFDALIAEIEKKSKFERPIMANGRPLLEMLKAENGAVIQPETAFTLIRDIGMENLAVDLQPIVREFNAAVRDGTTAGFNFSEKLAKQAEFLTGDHRNNPSDATLIAMIEAYNNNTPLKADDLLKFMSDHRSPEHEFIAAYKTLAEKNGKTITAQDLDGFVKLSGNHFSEDLMARVGEGITAASEAEKNGEHKKVSVLIFDEEKGKSAEETDKLEAETMAKLHAAFGVLADGKGNVFYDPITNAVLDPSSAVASADEKLTAEDKRAGYQHVALAQYDHNERAALGFTCAWANVRDNTNKSIEKLMASRKGEVQNTVEKAGSMARNYGIRDARVNKAIESLMKGTLHYNIPGEPHPADITFGELTSLAQFKHQNEKMVENVIASERKQKAAAQQAEFNKKLSLVNASVFGKANAVFVGEPETLDGMSVAETYNAVRNAEKKLLAGIRSFDPKAVEQLKDSANRAEGERAAYVHRNDPLVRAFPDLYAQAVALKNGNEHAGKTLVKTMDEYAHGYSIWLVATANMYASERGPSAVAELRSMIQDRTALAMYADYVRGQEPEKRSQYKDYDERCRDAVTLLASGDTLDQIQYVRKVEEKIDGYCMLHGLNEQVFPQQYSETIQNAYVYEPGVDQPIPLEQVRTPEQVCSIASAMLDAGQEEQAMRFLDTIAHRSVIEAQQIQTQHAAEAATGNAPAGKPAPVCTRDDSMIVSLLANNFKATAATLAIIGVYEAECLKPRGETISKLVAERLGDRVTPELSETLNRISARAAEAADGLKARVNDRKEENDLSRQRTRED